MSGTPRDRGGFFTPAWVFRVHREERAVYVQTRVAADSRLEDPVGPVLLSRVSAPGTGGDGGTGCDRVGEGPEQKEDRR